MHDVARSKHLVAGTHIRHVVVSGAGMETDSVTIVADFGYEHIANKVADGNGEQKEVEHLPRVIRETEHHFGMKVSRFMVEKVGL